MVFLKMYGSSNSLPTILTCQSRYSNGFVCDTYGGRNSCYNVPFYENDRHSYKKKQLRNYNSALDLVSDANCNNKVTVWRNLPEVVFSGQVQLLPKRNLKLQEALFEVIISEASYLKRLQILESHFMEKLRHLLNPPEFRDLFELVKPIRQTSKRFLSDLDKRWIPDVIFFDICDIIHSHAVNYFHIYVTYCSNQACQERCLAQLKAKNPEFLEALKKLEMDPAAQYQSLQSFLITPVQRITRLPLLMEAIIKYFDKGSEKHRIYTMALTKLKQIVCECNETTKKTYQWEEMLILGNKFEFHEVKRIPLSRASRWLVKQGVVHGFSNDFYSNKDFSRTLVKPKDVKPIWLFAFNDLVVIAKKKNCHEERYIVSHCCERNLIVVFDNFDMLPEKPAEEFHCCFQLCLLGSNKYGQREFFIYCSNEKEKQDWLEAIVVNEDDGLPAYYEEWDCPQVKSIYQYTAELDDELPIETNEIFNVLRKSTDGWYLGTRVRDGAKGWFPGNFVQEIVSSHSKAKSLRQGYRALRQKKSDDIRRKEIEEKKTSFFFIQNTTKSSKV